MVKNVKSERIISYDLLRTLAILGVVMIHASSDCIQNADIRSAAFAAANILNGLSRIAVPLFVMVSGALMLDESKPSSIRSMARRAGKTLLILYAWSLFYMLITQVAVPWHFDGRVDWKAAFNALLYGHYHLWYLFMLAGLYLITPVLRLMTRPGHEKSVLWFILLSLLFQFLPNLLNPILNLILPYRDILLRWTGRFQLGYVAGYTAYYLLGWVLTQTELPEIWKKLLYAAGIAGVLVTVAGTRFLVRYDRGIYDFIYSDLSINVFFTAAAVFTLACSRPDNQTGRRWGGVLRFLSDMSFGIYVLHPLIIQLGRIFILDQFSVLQILFNWTVGLCGALLITFILSQIPLLRRLVWR